MCLQVESGWWSLQTPTLTVGASLEEVMLFVSQVVGMVTVYDVPPSKTVYY